MKGMCNTCSDLSPDMPTERIGREYS